MDLKDDAKKVQNPIEKSKEAAQKKQEESKNEAPN